MKARRLEIAAVLLLAGWIVAWLTFGSAGVEHTAASAGGHAAPLLQADVGRAVAPTAFVVGPATVGNIDVAVGAESRMDAAAVDGVETAMPMATDTARASSSETRSVTVASASPFIDVLPDDAPEAANPVAVADDCLATDACVDGYLWALYQRTPKEDTIKVQERRKVTVKRKGKRVTVTRSFTKLVDEDFAWKDPKAAGKAGMAMMDYVIGGMDWNFKRKLFQALRAAEEAGLSPGITSAFRDDYRQSIASGLKAATERSWHGGSFRGGYGNGLAADIVSVKGGTRAQRWVSTEVLWKWIDSHEKEFGIGRPYLDRDPPHVAPVDGKEYVARRGPKVAQAASEAKTPNRLADGGKAKRPGT